jgi:hypothetical protein
MEARKLVDRTFALNVKHGMTVTTWVNVKMAKRFVSRAFPFELYASAALLHYEPVAIASIEGALEIERNFGRKLFLTLSIVSITFA